MRVRWDESASATAHGQLVFFTEFLAAMLTALTVTLRRQNFHPSALKTSSCFGSRVNLALRQTQGSIAAMCPIGDPG
jgi:hypothetical protein